MMKDYRTRKEQIEKDFLRSLMRDIRKLMGKDVPRSVRRRLAEELRSAAMVGACEERSHCLKAVGSGAIASQIMARSVMEVLGYEK